MKNLYRVISKTGATLCFQVAASEKEAVITAKAYYGHRAAKAEFVREA